MRRSRSKESLWGTSCPVVCPGYVIWCFLPRCLFAKLADVKLMRPDAGRVLCFAPHPDDEVIGPGGALCLHRRQGDDVRVVVATDGTAGDPDGHYGEEGYEELRRQESRRGLGVLGVSDVVFWGQPDSCVLSEIDLEMVAQMAAKEVEEYGPGIVYLPWELEGNSDHAALHGAVGKALERVGFRGVAYGYEVWNAMVPDVILDITEVADTKRKALKCYESQLRYTDYEHVIFGLHAYRSLVHDKGRGFCEAYRVVRSAAEKS